MSSHLSAASTTSDVQVVLLANGASDYFVQSFAPASANVVTSTGSGNLDPTMTLQIGKRYKFTFADFFSHPFSLVALDPVSGFSDTVLLQQGGSTGSLEGDTAIDWNDQGADFYFTLTPGIADAMDLGANTPGYHCEIHPDQMRGAIVFAPAASPLVWPAGTETFENAQLGTNVDLAIAGWSIVGGNASYEADISNSPAGNPNQVPGSTRWLTITDVDPTATGNVNRVYSNSILAPNDITVSEYTFTARLNVQSLGAVNSLVIAQHFDTAPTAGYKNVGGIQITPAGLNAVINGTADGGIGITGPTVTAPLYLYGDAGGFAQDTWVPVEFTINFTTGQIIARATGTSGAPLKTATVSGLALPPTGQRANLRFCIRNNGLNNVSLISYDNVTFAGVGVTTTVDGMELYR